MAYGDTASAYGRGEANGGGFGPSRGRAVGREARGMQIGNWAGAPVSTSGVPGGGLPSLTGLTNFQRVNLNAIERGTQSEPRPGSYMAGLGLGGGPGAGGGLSGMPQAPRYVRPVMGPPPIRPRYLSTIPFGPPQPAPETPAPEAPVTPSWGYQYGTDYVNPATYSPAVNPYKSNYGGGGGVTPSNPLSSGWGLRR